MEEQLPELSLLDYVADFFVGLSPVWLLVDVLLLLAAAVWLARRAWPWLRILRALYTAPLATIASGVSDRSADSTAPDAVGNTRSSTLVKLLGQAHPVPNREGEMQRDISYVWKVVERYDSRRIRSFMFTGSYSVATMLLRDATGECTVNPREATVVPSTIRGERHQHLFGESSSRTERLIRPGDKVVAIGELRRVTNRADPKGVKTFKLAKPKGGVLLYSANSERYTRARFHALFWPTALATVLCGWLGVWGAWQHLGSYADSPGQYVEALTSIPFESYPGAPRGEATEDGGGPQAKADRAMPVSDATTPR